ncbi:transferase [Syncephalis pseudoplumigaleata]|uniref:Transferase n=1 Tax=Syncephalis pseudoplumigaleata TaxID=1712513 RepID=A0A4P9Z5Y9_9FUNG|nr:transferase [Syncephalis pseudoplumigaleata]|eukprot:RKP28057.1 transferase [Syncephalis pseudoplumigaleata]
MTVTVLSGEHVSGAMPEPTYTLKPLAADLPSAVSLTPADEVVPRCYIRHLYFYRNQAHTDDFMPTTKLVSALHRALELYPLVYGRIHCRPDGRLELRHGESDGVPVYVEQAAYGFEVFGRSWPHAQTPAGLEPIGEVVPDETLPLFLVKITRLHNNEGVVIGTAGCHNMMDGHSIEILLQAWAAISRGALPDAPVLDRHLVRVTGQPQFRHPEFRWMHQAIEPPRHFGPLVLFHISEEKLAQLKAEASRPLIAEHQPSSVDRDTYARLSADVAWISTNDALCALIWRATIRARQLDPRHTTNLSIPIDARGRFKPALPSNYFGNGSLGYEATDEVHKLVSHPLSYVARLLRKQQQDTGSAAFLQSAINYLGTLPEHHRIDHPFAALTGVDFLITNLRSFDFYDIDFGYGRAMQFRLPHDLLSVAAYIVNMPSSPDGNAGDGVQIFIGLDADSMNRLCKDDEFNRYATMIG